MFCISYGIMGAIGSKNIFPYLFILYGSALLFGLFTRPPYTSPDSQPAKKQTSPTENMFQLIDVCIIDSFSIMIKLCGYLILFSIISKGIFMLFPKNSAYPSAVIASFLEITNGLSVVSGLPIGIPRSAAAVAALSFGGLCCIFQTNSVLRDTGLSLKKYILHKTLITLLALFLFFLWSFFGSFAVNGWR